MRKTTTILKYNKRDFSSAPHMNNQPSPGPYSYTRQPSTAMKKEYSQQLNKAVSHLPKHHENTSIQHRYLHISLDQSKAIMLILVKEEYTTSSSSSQLLHNNSSHYTSTRIQKQKKKCFNCREENVVKRKECHDRRTAVKQSRKSRDNEIHENQELLQQS